MSPESGCTAAIFPIDEVTVDYLRLTGRTNDLLALVEAYAKAQGMWHDAEKEPVFSEYIELDLVDVVPSIAGPKHPQDRVLLSESYLVLTSRGRNRTAHRQCLPLLDDTAGLRDQAQFARSLGLLGKSAIHARQLDILHEVFTPSEAFSPLPRPRSSGPNRYLPGSRRPPAALPFPAASSLICPSRTEHAAYLRSQIVR